MAALLQLTAGTVVGGDYRILTPLGAGGMGAVYVAEQLSTGKRRALKVMHPGLVEDARSRERFVQEARVGALIKSDHVVEVVAAGVESETGMPWIAMELLEGEDLSDFVRHHGYLSPRQLGDMLEQLCHALGAAHREGVVHRDIKPENVFITRARSVTAPLVLKVLDFGIAKVAARAKTTATSTIGSPAWMAPEQTDPRAPITPATDIWAVGLMTFWLLTGRPFWHALADPHSSILALMKEILFEPVVTASARAVELGVSARLPRGYDAWFARTTERDPKERFQSATEMLASFQALLRAAGFETSAMPESSPFSFARGATVLSDAPPAFASESANPHEITDFVAGLPPREEIGKWLNPATAPRGPRGESASGRAASAPHGQTTRDEDVAAPADVRASQRARAAEGAGLESPGDGQPREDMPRAELPSEDPLPEASPDDEIEAPPRARRDGARNEATRPARASGARGFGLGLGVAAALGLVAWLALRRTTESGSGAAQQSDANTRAADSAAQADRVAREQSPGAGEAGGRSAATTRAPTSRDANAPDTESGAPSALVASATVTAPSTATLGDGPPATSATLGDPPASAAAPPHVASGLTSYPPAPPGGPPQPPRPPPPPPFDREDAQMALRQWAQSAQFACRGLNGSTAFGVTVTVEGSGGVSELSLDPNEPWTAAGNCVSGHLRGLRVAPFAGPPQMLATAVSLAKGP